MDIDLVRCSGAEVLLRLEQLRSDFPSTGKYPFLIGEQSEAESIKSAIMSDEREPSEIVAKSLLVDIPSWFKAQEAEARKYEFEGEEALGYWAGESDEKGSISIHCDILTGKIKETVYIGLAAIEQPWMLPSEMKYGGWNACPDAVIHCAIMRHWNEQHGAEIVSLSHDVIECKVARPPRTKEEAINLAWQQLWYCDDIVYQGTETVSNLASSLINSDYWYFWWD